MTDSQKEIMVGASAHMLGGQKPVSGKIFTEGLGGTARPSIRFEGMDAESIREMAMDLDYLGYQKQNNPDTNVSASRTYIVHREHGAFIVNLENALEARTVLMRLSENHPNWVFKPNFEMSQIDQVAFDALNNKEILDHDIFERALLAEMGATQQSVDRGRI